MKSSSSQDSIDSASVSSFNFENEGFLNKLRDPIASSILRNLKAFVSSFSIVVHTNSASILKKASPQKIGLPSSIQDSREKLAKFQKQITNEIAKNQLWRNSEENEIYLAAKEISKYLCKKFFTRIYDVDSMDEEDAIFRQKCRFLSFIDDSEFNFYSNTTNGIDKNHHILLETMAKELVENLEAKFLNSTAVVPFDLLELYTECIKNMISKVERRILELESEAIANADFIFPLIVLLVIKTSRVSSNVKWLYNLHYIDSILTNNQYLMFGEYSYYFTSLMAAVEFIATTATRKGFKCIFMPHCPTTTTASIVTTPLVADASSSIETPSSAPSTGKILLTGIEGMKGALSSVIDYAIVRQKKDVPNSVTSPDVHKQQNSAALERKKRFLSIKSADELLVGELESLLSDYKSLCERGDG